VYPDLDPEIQRFVEHLVLRLPLFLQRGVERLVRRGLGGLGEHLPDRAPQQFRLGVLEQFLGALVDVREPELFVDGVEGVVDPREYLVEFALHVVALALQALGLSLVVGDVLPGRDDPFDVPVVVQHRCRVDREPALARLRKLDDRLPVEHRFARLQSPGERVLLGIHGIAVPVVDSPVIGGVLVGAISRDFEDLADTLVHARDLSLVVEDLDPDRTGLQDALDQVALALYRLLGPSPEDEVAQVGGDRGNDVHQLLVDLPGLAHPEHKDGDRLVVGDDRNAQRRLQAGRERRVPARVLLGGSLLDVVGPLEFAGRPDASRKPLAFIERVPL